MMIPVEMFYPGRFVGASRPAAHSVVADCMWGCGFGKTSKKDKEARIFSLDESLWELEKRGVPRAQQRVVIQIRDLWESLPGLGELKGFEGPDGKFLGPPRQISEAAEEILR